MNASPLRLALTFAGLTILLLSGILFSLTIGARASIDLSSVLASLWSFNDSIDHNVIRDIRWPRTATALFVGIHLSLAGLLLQSITRNDLASPSLLGIHQGASLGLAFGLVFPALVLFHQQFMAVLGALAGGLLTFSLAGGLTGRLSPIRLILAGVAVSAFAIALVRFVFLLEDNLARQIIQWTAGDISGMRWEKMHGLGYWSVLHIAIAVFLSHRLNLFALGDGACQSLGVNPAKLRWFCSGFAAIFTGITVAIAGPILFVGLIIPHLSKSLFGNDHRVLVPCCVLLGGTLLVTADGVSKLLNFPYETPVGIVCALIGAPYFIYQTITVRNMGT